MSVCGRSWSVCGIHREVEVVGGIGVTMLLGIVSRRSVARRHAPRDGRRRPLGAEDLAFALSVVLLGLLMMVTRRNAVSQIIGFMSLENGLILAATGAKGMPLVVEISVAFSVLIAFIVIGIFLFRIRERSTPSTCKSSTASAEAIDEQPRVRTRKPAADHSRLCRCSFSRYCRAIV